jgi:2-dehydropantoate 2-reductase
LRVGVLGAGAIGGFLGLLLASAGLRVTFVGRRELGDARATFGAILCGGHRISVPDASVLADDPAALRDVDVCLVCVKSRDTETAATELVEHLPTGATVVSFQNGLHNPERLRERLGPRVAAGIVTFNVSRGSGYVLRQTTAGKLLAEPLDGPHRSRMHALGSAFGAAGVRLELRNDMPERLAGKLLLNLNNGVCAATGLSIRESLSAVDPRWLFARCVQEGLDVLTAQGRRPRSVGGVPLSLLPHVLALPQWLVTWGARHVQASARSSTLQDLDAGRTTEIDELNGEIVAFGERLAVAVPANGVVVETVRGHERRVAQGERPEFVSAARLRREVERRMAEIDATWRT